jgi:hypothetical protein
VEAAYTARPGSANRSVEAQRRALLGRRPHPDRPYAAECILYRKLEIHGPALFPGNLRSVRAALLLRHQQGKANLPMPPDRGPLTRQRKPRSDSS